MVDLKKKEVKEKKKSKIMIDNIKKEKELLNPTKHFMNEDNLEKEKTSFISKKRTKPLESSKPKVNSKGVEIERDMTDKEMREIMELKSGN